MVPPEKGDIHQILSRFLKRASPPKGVKPRSFFFGRKKSLRASGASNAGWKPRADAFFQTTWTLSELSPLAWPMVHVEANNKLRNEADLVLCVGSDVGETDWWGKAPYWAPSFRQRWIQVDVDERVLGRNRPVSLAVLADAKRFLARLAERSGRPQHADRRAPQGGGDARRGQVRRPQRARRRARQPQGADGDGARRRRARAKSSPTTPSRSSTAATPPSGATSTPRSATPGAALATAHFGHLGAGVGQALGAASRGPTSRCSASSATARWRFQMQEIETAVRNDLRPVFLVCADRQWGMVKINQKVALGPVKESFKFALGPDHEGTINTDLGEIEWNRVAEAMGAHGERVAHPDELVPALQRCVAANRCAVVHVDVDPGAHLFAPALLHFKAMHAEPAGE